MAKTTAKTRILKTPTRHRREPAFSLVKPGFLSFQTAPTKKIRFKDRPYKGYIISIGYTRTGKTKGPESAKHYMVYDRNFHKVGKGFFNSVADAETWINQQLQSPRPVKGFRPRKPK